MEAGLIAGAILTCDVSDAAQTDKGRFGHASRHCGIGAGHKEGMGGIFDMTLPVPIIGVGPEYRR
jgi:hypothetical protein